MQRLTRFFLWIFVLTVPLEYVVRIGPLGSISRIAGVLAFGATLFSIVRRKNVRSLGHVHYIMLAFLLWGGVSYFWSLDPDLTLGRISTYSQILLMIWLVWETARDETDQARLMQAYVLGAAIAAVGAIVGLLSNGASADLSRATSFGFDPNDQALTLALAVPIAWTLAIKKGTTALASNFYRAFVGLAVLAVLLSGSRGGMLAMIPALSIVVTSSSGRTIRQKLALVFLISVTVLAVSSLVPDYAWQRVLSIQTELQGGDFSGRKYIWTTGLQVFLDHPLLGIGAGAFGSAVSHLSGDAFLAHNTFLSILAEQGIIGLALFMFMIGDVTYLVFRLPRGRGAAWFTSLAVWAVGVSSLTWEYRKPTWVLLALIAGQVSTYPRWGQKSRNEGSPD